MSKFSIIIPAYNPNKILIELVQNLISSNVDAIIVINDGSNHSCNELFNELKNLNTKVIILEHQTNQGKGAALKTGFTFFYANYQDNTGIVTADADGQHVVNDIILIGQKLINNPNDLIIGMREFSNNNKVPFRSKFGNLLTKRLFKLIVGHKVNDTQSGLRGISTEFIPGLLTIDRDGYEFELSMLLACTSSGRKILEVPINTVYIENNKSSHFNPLKDSIKIYLVLFRFGIHSLVTYIVNFLHLNNK